MDHADILIDYIKSRGIQMSTDDYTQFLSVRAGFFVGVIRAWITNGKKETPEQVSETISRQHDNVVNSKLLTSAHHASHHIDALHLRHPERKRGAPFSD